jgi:hypothetical protein
MRTCFIILLFFVSHLLYAQEWSAPVKISQGGYNDDPDFCIDHDGTIHCVWTHRITDRFYKIFSFNYKFLNFYLRFVE